MRLPIAVESAPELLSDTAPGYTDHSKNPDPGKGLSGPGSGFGLCLKKLFVFIWLACRWYCLPVRLPVRWSRLL